MQLDYLNKTSRKISKTFFNALVKKAEKIISQRISKLCPGFHSQDLALSLTLIGDQGMTPLHEEWRLKKGPTDVLSFSFVEKPSDFPFDGNVGDIVISVDTIATQAKKHHWSFEQELAKMFVHGFLHIFGYDHETDREEAEMEALAEKIL